jgi:hypothetical protein
MLGKIKYLGLQKSRCIYLRIVTVLDIYSLGRGQQCLQAIVFYGILVRVSVVSTGHSTSNGMIKGGST